jgi:hypothetical protein
MRRLPHKKKGLQRALQPYPKWHRSKADAVNQRA